MGRHRILTGNDPFSPPALRAAWSRVRANAGAPGPDGVCVEAFGRGVEARLATLAGEIASGAYRPGGLRHAPIPKPYGGLRVLAIPDVRDRVAQCAAAAWLSDRLDPKMSDGSFGYRPGRGVDLALAKLRRAHGGGMGWTLDADIESFFDRAPHRLVLRELDRWIGADAGPRRIIALWLKGFGRGGRGLAQGSPVSPILANLLLDPLDRAFERRGTPIVRYADDFVVPVATERAARAARRAAAAALRRLGLKLNAAKTAIRAPGESFVFLGETVDALDPGPKDRMAAWR